MGISTREHLELHRSKVSEAGRMLREWQELKPILQKKADKEDAGQGSLDLDDDPD